MLKINNGDFKILESGIVNSNFSKPVEFNLTSNGGKNLKFVVKTLILEDTINTKMDFELIGEDILLITFLNPHYKDRFPNPHFTEPLCVGEFNNEDLYIFLNIETSSNKSYVLHYTFYLKQKEE